MENTTENNKLIAEFMGSRFTDEPTTNGRDFYNIPTPANDSTMSGIYELNRIQYHSSWDWLMPVVDKINHTGKSGGIKYGLFDALGNADLDRAYSEVVQFIKWYNKSVSGIQY